MHLKKRLKQHLIAPLSVHLAIFMTLFAMWASRTNLFFPMTTEYQFFEQYIRPTFYTLLILLAVLKIRWIWIAGAMCALFDVNLYIQLLLRKDIAIFLTNKTMFTMKLAQLIIMAIIIPFIWIRTRHYFRDEPPPVKMNRKVFRKVSLIFSILIAGGGFAFFIYTTNQAGEIEAAKVQKECEANGTCLPKTE